MEADIDFDVIAHLGFVRNIDVASRGVYFVRLTLLYGDDEQRVAPIGLFSAPSRLDSFVADQRVPPPPFLNVCHIDNEDQTFRCRSFVIRYRDERHELNDGVHWRLTIPQVDLVSWRGGIDLLANGSPPQVGGLPGGLLFEDRLQIHCELFHAPLLDAPPGLNMMFDVATVIPHNPVFEAVSSQKIVIQNYGWAGFHEYYPVRFDRSHCVDLDMMVHCGITDIKYRRMTFGVLPSAERFVQPKRAETGPASTPPGLSPHTSNASTIPYTSTTVGSVTVQDTSFRADIDADESFGHGEGEYPAGIGIWYTRSNVAATDLTPNSSAQPLRRNEFNEDHLSPLIEGVPLLEAQITPQKESPALETVCFDTPATMGDIQYCDFDEADQVSPLNNSKRTSLQPPRKSFTPGLLSTVKHRKTNSMPIVPTSYSENNLSQTTADDNIFLADELYSPSVSPIAKKIDVKTPISRKSYQPARKSFTPGPNSLSTRKVAREEKEPSQIGNMSLLFTNSKASPVRVVTAAALERTLMDEESLSIDDFDEDKYASNQAQAAQTGYSYDVRIDAAMRNESLRDVSINIEFPEEDEIGELHIFQGNETPEHQQLGDASMFAIHVPLIHTETPSPLANHKYGSKPGDESHAAIVPIVLRHQITTVVQRRRSDRFGDRHNATPPVNSPSYISQPQENEAMTPSTSNLNDAMIGSGPNISLSNSPKRNTGGHDGDDVLSYGRAFESGFRTDGESPYFPLDRLKGKSNTTRRITACGVELDDAQALLCSYFGPVIANHKKLLAGMGWILKLLSKQQQNNGISSSTVHDAEDIEILSPDLNASIMNAESISTLKNVMLMYVNNSSLDKCAGVWKQLFVALPKVMPHLLPILKKRYIQIIHGFWKDQIMVHTCRDTNMTKVHPAEASAAQLLEAMLKIENEHGYFAAGYQYRGDNAHSNFVPNTPSVEVTDFDMAELLSPPLAIDICYQPIGRGKRPICKGHLGDTDSNNSISNSPNFFLPARGMRLYDSVIHGSTNRLPTIVIQQYISNRRLKEITPQKLAIYRPKEGIQRGGPLIGVEPTALAMALKMHNSSERVRQSASSIDANINTVKLSLQNEFSSEAANENIVNVVLGADVSTVSNSTNSKTIIPSLPYDFDTMYGDDGVETDSLAKQKGPHLIFLQHGFKGCAYDMRLLRNAITAMFPENTQVYAAESNEKESEESIELMGQRLAIEVHQYVKSREPKMLKDPLRGRVSFIGHSVGGLIIRKALESELLKPLLCKLHLYMSLASPHLGTLYADSQLVSTGMWALFKLQKASVLRELALDDVRRDDMTKSLLYRLSENGMFMYFKWVVFASSPKDQYVPHYSARVQVSTKAVADSRTGPAIVSMAANVMAQTDPSRLFRVSIDNNTGVGVNINNMIGRTAHICYLDNPVVVEQLVYSLSGFFQ